MPKKAPIIYYARRDIQVGKKTIKAGEAVCEVQPVAGLDIERIEGGIKSGAIDRNAPETEDDKDSDK